MSPSSFANMMFDDSKIVQYNGSSVSKRVHQRITQGFLDSVGLKGESIFDNAIIANSTCAFKQMDRNTVLDNYKIEDEDDDEIIRSMALEMVGCALKKQFSSYNKNLIIEPQVSYYTQGVRVEYHF